MTGRVTGREVIYHLSKKLIFFPKLFLKNNTPNKAINPTIGVNIREIRHHSAKDWPLYSA